MPQELQEHEREEKARMEVKRHSRTGSRSLLDPSGVDFDKYVSAVAESVRDETEPGEHENEVLAICTLDKVQYMTDDRMKFDLRWELRAELQYHHSRIEIGPDGGYDLKEYNGGEKVGVVGEFDTPQEAEQFHGENFDFPLRDVEGHLPE